MASRSLIHHDFKVLAIQLYRALERKKVHADIIILFGSHAKGKAHADSDIDLAVVSRDFGKDRIKEGAMVNLLVSEINPRAEVVPVGLDAYFDKENISPILHEIKKTGICLL